VVSINAFPTDTEAEHALIKDAALKAGAFDAVISKSWALGGEGAADLAMAVDKAASMPHEPKLLYPLDMSLKDKIEIIARQIYRAGSVVYTPEANAALEKYTALGYGNFPICMAKTQYSLSHDPALKGAPKGFEFPVREVRLSAGAGFIVPITGEITTMPGLPSKPAYIGMDIDTATGRITGLS